MSLKVKNKPFCSGLRRETWAPTHYPAVLRFISSSNSFVINIYWMNTPKCQSNNKEHLSRFIMRRPACTRQRSGSSTSIIPPSATSSLCSLSPAISQHGAGSQPLLWHLPVVQTWRGNFFFSPSSISLLPSPSWLLFAKVQLVLLTSKVPVGDGRDQIPL